MKQIYYLLTVMALCLFISCDDDDKDSAWHEANEAAFNEIGNTPDWKHIYYGNSLIYYKVIEKGDGTVQPGIDDRVDILYKGWLYNGEVFDEGTTKDNEPHTFTVGELNLGLVTALRNMKKGDVWQVCIPYELGYGKKGAGKVPGYSTLFFEIELVRVMTQNK